MSKVGNTGAIPKRPIGTNPIKKINNTTNTNLLNRMATTANSINKIKMLKNNTVNVDKKDLDLRKKAMIEVSPHLVDVRAKVDTGIRKKPLKEKTLNPSTENIYESTRERLVFYNRILTELAENTPKVNIRYVHEVDSELVLQLHKCAVIFLCSLCKNLY